ncbi:hypothetical protein PoB_004087200 [Plakobranchus ocellatus]|uniref:Uncharacterized protein n=1 Tax=Plakobranchus ocellatus TaxID=259542 RepID=A0AAV4B5A7_9GAST|nr:hypothetical protein PoB_004087200 [Plakobranchus ocellatus]
MWKHNFYNVHSSSFSSYVLDILQNASRQCSNSCSPVTPAGSNRAWSVTSDLLQRARNARMDLGLHSISVSIPLHFLTYPSIDSSSHGRLFSTSDPKTHHHTQATQIHPNNCTVVYIQPQRRVRIDLAEERASLWIKKANWLAAGV